MKIKEIVESVDLSALMVERHLLTEYTTELYRRFATEKEKKREDQSDVSFTDVKGDLTIAKSKLDTVIERIEMVKAEQRLILDKKSSFNHKFKLAAKFNLKPETYKRLSEMTLVSAQDIRLNGKFIKEYLE